MTSEAEFIQLLEKYYKDNLSEPERDLLFQLISDGQFKEILKESIFQNLHNPIVSGSWSKEMEEGILAELLLSVNKRKKSIQYSLNRMIAVAAIFLVVIGAAYFIWFSQPISNKSYISQVIKKDIVPGREGAVLTLSNGQQIVLDSVANGKLIIQGSTQVNKENGQLIYKNSEGTDEESIAYNTLSTPRGRQFEVTLPDGTSVWLNAGSSITYPTTFSGKSREVSITGEVYFEVTKNPSMPFHVKVNDMNVTVLGTHFNINSYTNEASIKTTLMEGSVLVSKGNETSLLKPGQQAEFNNTGKSIAIHDDVDLDQAMAWKNGFTSFKSADIKSIMRQVERWYDVDVSFEGNIPLRKFTADVSRNAPVSEILKILEESKIHYRIEDKKIIVIP